MRPIDRAQAIKDMTSFEWRGNASGKLDKVKGQQKLTFDKEPDYIYNKEGEIVGVDAWVRLFGSDGKEVKIDPHRRIINPPTVPRSGIVETKEGRQLTPDPSEAFYETVWDSVVGTPNPKGWRTRGTVTTVFGDSSDGQIQSGNFDTSYSSVRQGLNLTVDTTGTLRVGQTATTTATPDTFYWCYELFLAFDTSAIADDDVVSGVVVDLWLSSFSVSANAFIFELRERNWGPTLTTGDYVAGSSLGSSTLVASIASSALASGGTGSYKTLTSEIALLSVSSLKTGTVYLLGNTDRHRLNQSPGVPPMSDVRSEQAIFISSNNSGTTQDPKLTITHEASFVPSVPRFTQRPNRVWRLY